MKIYIDTDDIDDEYNKYNYNHYITGDCSIYDMEDFETKYSGAIYNNSVFNYLTKFENPEIKIIKKIEREAKRIEAKRKEYEEREAKRKEREEREAKRIEAIRKEREEREKFEILQKEYCEYYRNCLTRDKIIHIYIRNDIENIKKCISDLNAQSYHDYNIDNEITIYANYINTINKNIVIDKLFRLLKKFESTQNVDILEQMIEVIFIQFTYNINGRHAIDSMIHKYVNKLEDDMNKIKDLEKKINEYKNRRNKL